MRLTLVLYTGFEESEQYRSEYMAFSMQIRSSLTTYKVPAFVSVPQSEEEEAKKQV
jgi:hypothetical protein